MGEGFTPPPYCCVAEAFPPWQCGRNTIDEWPTRIDERRRGSTNEETSLATGACLARPGQQQRQGPKNVVFGMSLLLSGEQGCCTGKIVRTRRQGSVCRVTLRSCKHDRKCEGEGVKRGRVYPPPLVGECEGAAPPRGCSATYGDVLRTYGDVLRTYEDVLRVLRGCSASLRG